MPANLKKIQSNLRESQIIENISSINEITATIRINQIRNGMIASDNFFKDLWNIYRQILRSAPAASLPQRKWKYDKTLSLIITSSGDYSGPSDEEVLTTVFEDEETANGDFIVVGSKSLAFLKHRGKQPIMAFEMPDIRFPIDTTEISSLARQYKHAWVFFQSFESIGIQQTKRINLLPSSVAISNNEALGGRLIDVQSYIFEPSLQAINDYLEVVVMNITLTQIIFEAKLSEYANNFKDSSLAKDRANEKVKELTMTYSRKKRQIKDEALRQQLFQGGLL